MTCQQCPTKEERLLEKGKFKKLLPGPSYERGRQCASSGHWGSIIKHYGKCPGCEKEFLVSRKINSPDFVSFSQPDG